MTHARRRALRLVPLALVALLLLLFARRVDWHAASAAARAADPRLLLLAATVNLASLALKGVRWWVFLRGVGVRPLGLAMRATFAGASLNNLLVAQGGEGARTLLVSRAAGVSSARVLAALALDRALDALSYLALLVGAAWLLPLPAAISRWRGAATFALVVALALVAALLARGERTRGGRGADPVGRVRGWLRHFGASVGAVASPGRLAAGAALSAGAWALQIATYHTVARAAHAPLPLTGSVAALLAVGISFLIRATPGNVGVFQVVYALTVRSFGVDEGAAVAVAVLIQLVQVVPVVGVGTVVGMGMGRRGVASSE